MPGPGILVIVSLTNAETNQLTSSIPASRLSLAAYLLPPGLFQPEGKNSADDQRENCLGDNTQVIRE